jgi:hypothetical protein
MYGFFVFSCGTVSIPNLTIFMRHSIHVKFHENPPSDSVSEEAEQD